MTQGYNGWSNYETWNWKLWLDNDYSSYRSTEEQAQECLNNAEGDKEQAAYDFSKILESNCNELQELQNIPTSGPFADLLQSAIEEINFYEIAESILSDIDYENDDDENDDDDENEFFDNQPS